MIKKLLVVLLVLAVVLTACKPAQQESSTTTDTESETGPSSVKVYEQDTSDEDVDIAPAEPAQENDPAVQNLIDKADTVSSVEYFVSKYVEGGVNKFAHVYLKGNKMKQKLELRSGTYEPGEFYDTVYIDLSSRTAVTYCEEYDRCIRDPNEEWSANFDDYLVETPFDVLDTIKSGKKTGTAIFDKKEVMTVEDTYQGRRRIVYLWTYKGLPLRYDIMNAAGGDEEIRVEYKGMVVNGVKDSELEHQHVTVTY